MGAKEELVDSFLSEYGDRYEGAMSKEELRATLLALKPTQLAAVIADSANVFDLADLEKSEAEQGLKWGKYGYESLEEDKGGRE